MKAWLKVNWGITASVVYDKAPDFFHPTHVVDRHALFTRLKPFFPPQWVSEVSFCITQPAGLSPHALLSLPPLLLTSFLQAGTGGVYDTLFTTCSDMGEIAARPDRPPLIVRYVNRRTQALGGSYICICHLAHSSTSWTPDEDFSILLEALVVYDQR